jgi:hypothetical protein
MAHPTEREEKRALAASAGADDADEFTVIDFKRRIVQRFYGSVLAFEYSGYGCRFEHAIIPLS